MPRKLAREALSKRLEVLLDGLGGGDRTGRQAPQLIQLLQAARGEAPELTDRVGRLTGAQLSADTAQQQRERHGDHEAATLRKLQVASLTHLPTVWQGKR